ncbi:hypothetical protein ACFRQM_18215 [Streptomyces sp. NPDC056831]|uniref:hypothetical protein n=1 Tax=Streptomyces sp. NPDC056831 TaxID=3345954 RepID=UPI00367D9BE8
MAIRATPNTEPVRRAIEVTADPAAEAGRKDSHAHDLDATWICRTCGEEVVMNTLTVDVRAPGWDRAGPKELSPTGN